MMDFRDLLSEILGEKDPVLRLTRLYATERWDELAQALEEFTDEMPIEPDPQQADRETLGRLYTLLHALGTGIDEEVERFDVELDPEFTGMVFDVLFQKASKNRTEQRFLDKIQGTIEQVKVQEVPDQVGEDYIAGQLLNAQDAEVVIYETEDGEVIEDFNEEDFEVVEEVEADPEDEDYEYVWVEEEVEEDEMAGLQEPADTY